MRKFTTKIIFVVSIFSIMLFFLILGIITSINSVIGDTNTLNDKNTKLVTGIVVDRHTVYAGRGLQEVYISIDFDGYTYTLDPKYTSKEIYWKAEKGEKIELSYNETENFVYYKKDYENYIKSRVVSIIWGSVIFVIIVAVLIWYMTKKEDIFAIEASSNPLFFHEKNNGKMSGTFIKTVAFIIGLSLVVGFGIRIFNP